jgi:SAM-dependent methyltransferase
MKLSHKIQKLFSREAFESLREHAGRWTHPVNSSRILETIDRARFSKLRERYPYKETSPRINRFEDADYWVGINVERAQDLWLDRTRRLRILDLGCGAGYFLYVCQFFGHETLGLDTDNEPLYRATTELLNVERVIARIEPNIPLLALGKRFDLVTAHRVCFHRMRRSGAGQPPEWTQDQWSFFIDDVRSNLLRPGGRLLLDFNPRPDGSSFFTAELREFFLKQGARIFRSKALLAANRAQPPEFRLKESASPVRTVPPE